MENTSKAPEAPPKGPQGPQPRKRVTIDLSDERGLVKAHQTLIEMSVNAEGSAQHMNNAVKALNGFYRLIEAKQKYRVYKAKYQQASMPMQVFESGGELDKSAIDSLMNGEEQPTEPAEPAK